MSLIGGSRRSGGCTNKCNRLTEIDNNCLCVDCVAGGNVCIPNADAVSRIGPVNPRNVRAVGGTGAMAPSRRISSRRTGGLTPTPYRRFSGVQTDLWFSQSGDKPDSFYVRDYPRPPKGMIYVTDNNPSSRTFGQRVLREDSLATRPSMGISSGLPRENATQEEIANDVGSIDPNSPLPKPTMPNQSGCGSNQYALPFKIQGEEKCIDKTIAMVLGAIAIYYIIKK
jgi:hypothetical protein